MRFLAGIAIAVFFVLALGRAWDQELASAGSPPVLKQGALSEARVQGAAILGGRAPRSAPSPQVPVRYQPGTAPPVVKHTSAVEGTYQGLSARAWAKRAVQQRKNSNARGRTIRRLQAALTVRPRDHSLRAIAFAATAYGVSYSTLRRKAYCETGGTFDPYAKNRHSTASGLFQFLTSTWASTPYASYSIFDPYANALAAGWMHAHGRGAEWACR